MKPVLAYYETAGNSTYQTSIFSVWKGKIIITFLLFSEDFYKDLKKSHYGKEMLFW